MVDLDAEEDVSFFVDLDIGEDRPCVVDLNAGEEDSSFEVWRTGGRPSFIDLDARGDVLLFQALAAEDDDPPVPPCRVSSPLKMNNHISVAYEEVPDLEFGPLLSRAWPSLLSYRSPRAALSLTGGPWIV